MCKDSVASVTSDRLNYCISLKPSAVRREGLTRYSTEDNVSLQVTGKLHVQQVSYGCRVKSGTLYPREPEPSQRTPAPRELRS